MTDQRAAVPRRRRYLRRALVFVLAGALGTNVVAYLHARALTHFVAAGARMPKPEELSGWEKLKTLLTGVRIPRPTNARTPADVGLAFETVTIPSTNAITLEAWLTRNPAGRGWVLLFHGYSESKQQTLLAARRFADLGFCTLSVDFRGSGGSTGGNQTTLGYFEADDVAAAVRWASTSVGADAPILYGFSMGSAAVLRAVGRLGLAPKAVIVEAAFDRMRSTVENRFHMMHLPAFPMARLLVFWGGFQNGFPGLAHNPVDYAADVTCPVLLIHGAQDDRVTVSEAQAIHAALRGPKTLRLVTGGRHEATAAMSPAEWRQLVEPFLDGVK